MRENEITHRLDDSSVVKFTSDSEIDPQVWINLAKMMQAMKGLASTTSITFRHDNRNSKVTQLLVRGVNFEGKRPVKFRAVVHPDVRYSSLEVGRAPVSKCEVCSTYHDFLYHEEGEVDGEPFEGAVCDECATFRVHQPEGDGFDRDGSGPDESDVSAARERAEEVFVEPLSTTTRRSLAGTHATICDACGRPEGVVEQCAACGG